VLAMVPLAAFAWWRTRPQRAARRHIPLAVVALLLWAIALSNHVAWGDRILFTIPLPNVILELAAMVRASARLVWVGYYALVLAVAAVVVRSFAARNATAILALGLGLQMADLSPRYIALHGYFRQHFIDEPAQRAESLTLRFWNVAAGHYRAILFVPSLPVPSNFAAIGLFAADHAMRINIGSFARFSVERVAGATLKREQALVNGRLDQEALYVLQPPDVASFRAGPDDAIGTVDGFRVLAPGWFRFEDCCGDGMPPLARAASAHPTQP
jgi:hypothetical protein